MTVQFLAQLSDSHIFPKGTLGFGKVDTAAMFAAAIDHLNKMHPKPSAVITTGDLINGGQKEEYQYFNTLAEKLELPFWPLPGNHDGPDFWNNFPQLDGMTTPSIGYGVAMDGYRCLLLDTTIPGKPHGEMNDSRLKWLENELAEHANTPTLIFMHHPPFDCGIGHMDIIRCRNADALARVVAGHDQILAIGCGHVHRFIMTKFAGHSAFIAPGCAHAVTFDLSKDGPSTLSLDPPSVLIHRLERCGDTMHHTIHQSFIGEMEGPYSFGD